MNNIIPPGVTEFFALDSKTFRVAVLAYLAHYYLQVPLEYALVTVGAFAAKETGRRVGEGIAQQAPASPPPTK